MCHCMLAPIVMPLSDMWNENGVLYIYSLQHRLPATLQITLSLHCPGFEDPTLVAVSDTVYFQDYNIPLQGHLALSNDSSVMM